MAKLTDLPHDLLLRLLIISANENLVTVCRWTYFCLRQTTPRICYKFVRQKGRWQRTRVIASALPFKFLSVGLLDQIISNEDELLVAGDGRKKKKPKTMDIDDLKIPNRLFCTESMEELPLDGKKRRQLKRQGAKVRRVSTQNQKRFNIVKKLLSMKLSVRESRGNIGLMLAAKDGNYPMVRLLLRKGADPQVGGENKALMMAVVYGHLPIVKRLVSAGAPITSLALRYAVQKKHLDVVNWLMKNGAAPDMVTIKLLDALQ